MRYDDRDILYSDQLQVIQPKIQEVHKLKSKFYKIFLFLCFRESTTLTSSSGSSASLARSSSFNVPLGLQSSCFQSFPDTLHPALERLSETRRKRFLEVDIGDVSDNNKNWMCFQQPNSLVLQRPFMFPLNLAHRLSASLSEETLTRDMVDSFTLNRTFTNSNVEEIECSKIGLALSCKRRYPKSLEDSTSPSSEALVSSRSNKFICHDIPDAPFSDYGPTSQASIGQHRPYLSSLQLLSVYYNLLRGSAERFC